MALSSCSSMSQSRTGNWREKKSSIASSVISTRSKHET